MVTQMVTGISLLPLGHLLSSQGPTTDSCDLLPSTPTKPPLKQSPTASPAATESEEGKGEEKRSKPALLLPPDGCRPCQGLTKDNSTRPAPHLAPCHSWGTGVTASGQNSGRPRGQLGCSWGRFSSPSAKAAMWARPFR